MRAVSTGLRGSSVFAVLHSSSSSVCLGVVLALGLVHVALLVILVPAVACLLVVVGVAS